MLFTYLTKLMLYDRKFTKNSGQFIAVKAVMNRLPTKSAVKFAHKQLLLFANRIEPNAQVNKTIKNKKTIFESIKSTLKRLHNSIKSKYKKQQKS